MDIGSNLTVASSDVAKAVLQKFVLSLFSLIRLLDSTERRAVESYANWLRKLQDREVVSSRFMEVA